MELEIYQKFMILVIGGTLVRLYEVNILGAVKLPSALDIVPTASSSLKVLFILNYAN